MLLCPALLPLRLMRWADRLRPNSLHYYLNLTSFAVACVNVYLLSPHDDEHGVPQLFPGCPETPLSTRKREGLTKREVGMHPLITRVSARYYRYTRNGGIADPIACLTLDPMRNNYHVSANGKKMDLHIAAYVRRDRHATTRRVGSADLGADTKNFN